MELKFKIKHATFLIIGVLIILADFIFLYGIESRWFKPLLAVGLLVAFIQYWLDFLNENKRQQEIELKFLEFVRTLVETVKSGIPIPKAIIHASNADLGSLTPHVKKLANQIEWGIPLREALKIFAKDTKNRIIIRSVSIVIEAEKSGGNIDQVLQAVTNSVLQIKKIKEERKSNTYSQMVQGYFIFFIFIVIMLILQIYLLPQLTEISGAVTTGIAGGYEAYMEGGAQTVPNTINFSTIFLWLVLIQGFFAGVMIGKFAEGELRLGLKHSLILMILSYLIITSARGF